MSEQKTILILGASSEMAIAYINHLKTPATVVALYNRSKEKLSQIQNQMISVHPLHADFNDLSALESLPAQILEKFGTPQVILHFAAPKHRFIRFKDATWTDFERDLHVQLRSAVCILAQILPAMAKARRGKVVFVLSSCTAGIPPKFLAHYVTAKYALLGLMKSLASEYADKSLQINAISPSMVETSFLTEIPTQIVDLAKAQHPLKRNASPADVQEIIEYLASDANGFVTGNNILVTGGSVF